MAPWAETGRPGKNDVLNLIKVVHFKLGTNNIIHYTWLIEWTNVIENLYALDFQSMSIEYTVEKS